MNKFKTKFTRQHARFINLYLLSKYNPHGIYKRVCFCEDPNIAFCKKSKNDENDYGWGCVNMENQILIPFDNNNILNCGRFLIADSIYYGKRLFNKKGQKIYEISNVIKTKNKSYTIILGDDFSSFRILIRKISISRYEYKEIYITDNGLAYMQSLDDKVGIILYSKLKVPFIYSALSIPQNGFMLGIKESKAIKDNFEPLYDCELLKVKKGIQKKNSIHTTNIMLFKEKTEKELKEYFINEKQFEADCNSKIYFNEKVKISCSLLKFFPFTTDNIISTSEDLEEEIYDDDYDFNDEKTYIRYNGSYAQDIEGWSDDDIDIVFEGDPDAYWNID